VRAALVVAVGVLVGCKDHNSASPTVAQQQQKPAPVTTPADASAAPPRPSLPTPPPPALGEPLSTDEAAEVLPKLDGKEILPLRQTSDKRQVHATWCLDGDGADDVARHVAQQLAAANYVELAVRGDAHKAGVQGDRDHFRLSMVVSASTAANCPAPKHYFASATIFRVP